MLIFAPTAHAQEAESPVILLDIFHVGEADTAVRDAIITVLDEAGFLVLPAGTIGVDAPALTITITTARTIRLTDAHYTPPSPLIQSVPDQPIAFESAATVLNLAYYATDNCAEAFEEPDNTLAFFMANCALRTGDYTSAIDLYEGIPGGDLTVAVNLAWAYLQTGATEQAFAVMDSAVVSASTEVQNAYKAAALAMTLADAGAIHALAFDFDTAINYLTQAIDISETYALPQPFIADLYTQRGDHIFLIYEWDRVLADYDRAIELDSTAANAYFARGVLYYTQGPRPLALEDFLRFIELAPDDARHPEAEGYIESIQAELDALGGDDVEAFPPGG
ncbi:MAG: tetratricopeptide repeat protein [Chloroflexota bacterium]